MRSLILTWVCMSLQIPAGHCPHDETPAAVHWCLQEWIASIEEDRPLCLNVGEEVLVDSQVR